MLDNVAGRAGLGGITMAASYHHGRDIFPHNPARKVHFLEGGVVFFQPDPNRYRRSLMQPRVSMLARESDVLADLCREASARSLRTRAWTVYLHNYTLGEAHPECACRNVFGDAHLTDLCPSNPDVRAYVNALTADIASKGVSTVVAESLHFHGLEHGFHHERYFIELGALGRYLLGLCFCEHCMAAARRRGVDVESLQTETRRELERRFESQASGPETHEMNREEVGAFAGGELAGYLEARSETVASLVAEAAKAAASEGADFAFIDLSGAVKGYATGRPQGDPAPSIAWQFGIDAGAVAKACGQIEAIGYAADPERLRLDVGAYRSIVGTDRLSVILRPMAPDCDSPENLAAKLAIARDARVTEAGFYHYGFMRLESLDLIRSALDLSV